MKKKVSKNHLFLSIFIILFLPFIINSFYALPLIDDFDFLSLVEENGFFKAQEDVYLHRFGRYSSIFLIMMLLYFFKSFVVFKIISLFFIAFSIHSVYYLLGKVYNLKKTYKLIASISFIFVIISTSLTLEDYYWTSATMHYFLGFILTNYFLTLLIDYKNINLNKKIALYFLVFCIMGTNEYSCVILFIILFLFNIIIHFKNEKTNKFFLFLFLFSLLLLLFVVSSPGNEYRTSIFPNNGIKGNLIKATLSSIKIFVVYSFKFILNLQFLLLMLFFVHLSKFSKKNSLFKINSTISKVYILAGIFVFFILIFPSLFFISYYSIGDQTPYRTVNVIYWFFVLFCFFSIQIISTNFNLANYFSNIIYIYIYSILVILSLILPPQGNNTYRNYYYLVVKDLVTKKTQTFYSKQMYIYQDLLKSDCQNCIIDRIPDEQTPQSMSYLSQSEYKSDTPDKARMNIYFDKQSIEYKK